MNPHTDQLPTDRPTDQDPNQRREARIAADTPVLLSVLNILGEPGFPGRVIDMSGSGLRVSVGLPVPCGAKVQLEGPDMVVLGEVCRCDEQDGSYEVGLIVSELRPR